MRDMIISFRSHVCGFSFNPAEMAAIGNSVTSRWSFGLIEGVQEKLPIPQPFWIKWFHAAAQMIFPLYFIQLYSIFFKFLNAQNQLELPTNAKESISIWFLLRLIKHLMVLQWKHSSSIRISRSLARTHWSFKWLQSLEESILISLTFVCLQASTGTAHFMTWASTNVLKAIEPNRLPIVNFHSSKSINRRIMSSISIFGLLR